MNNKLLYLFVAATMAFTSASHAAVSADEAAALGKTLTPVGAEMAANADGSIPAYTGGYTTGDPSFKPGVKGSKRKDFFAEDKPLYTITSANLDKYSDKLTDGVKALFKQRPDFVMHVYPTRRTAAVPKRIEEATLKNATTAKLTGTGIGYDAPAKGFPFPIPKNGNEVMWNHLSGWQGETMNYTSNCWMVTPNGNMRLASSGDQNSKSILYRTDGKNDFNGYVGLGRYVQEAPASKAGESILVHDTTNYEKYEYSLWQYLVGQRRVRRAPSVSYDTPDSVTSGIGFFDEAFMSFGPWFKHDMKLVGKKEMIVPYNNNKAANADPEKLMGKNFLNPELVRWELHRVWEVDANLKAGQRHVVPKRKYYFDEDTWRALLIDGWDADGKLWRFNYTLTYLAPDIPALMGAVMWGTYNLQQGGYYLNAAFNGKSVQPWVNPKIDVNMFTPDALSELGTR
jgi:hypothetical protein